MRSKYAREQLHSKYCCKWKLYHEQAASLNQPLICEWLKAWFKPDLSKCQFSNQLQRVLTYNWKSKTADICWCLFTGQDEINYCWWIGFWCCLWCRQWSEIKPTLCQYREEKNSEKHCLHNSRWKVLFPLRHNVNHPTQECESWNLIQKPWCAIMSLRIYLVKIIQFP